MVHTIEVYKKKREYPYPADGIAVAKKRQIEAEYKFAPTKKEKSKKAVSKRMKRV